MRFPVLLAAAIFIVSPATAQVYSGPVNVIDGDTLQMTDERIPLFGIDAPESDQTCTRASSERPYSKDAAATLAAMTLGKAVQSEQKDRDSYGRVVAICQADSTDLAEMLVRSGLTVSLPGFSDRYVEVKHWARQRGVGIWNGTFELSAKYRAMHPREFAKTAKMPALAQSCTRPAFAPQGTKGADAYFRSCREVSAVGIAPRQRRLSPWPLR